MRRFGDRQHVRRHVEHLSKRGKMGYTYFFYKRAYKAGACNEKSVYLEYASNVATNLLERHLKPQGSKTVHKALKQGSD